jgi:mRNA deadenylase 3'-5' endonuclease subunit Ccr4
MRSTTLPFSLATYNILAQAYITPERYLRTPATVLASIWRRPALVRHVVALNTDVVCLQEVEDETFAAVQQVLEPRGYIGHFARKGGGKPDGCATFIRQSALTLRRLHQLMYTDGSGTEPHAGHIALIVLLEYRGRTLGIVNTHLQWDPPDRPRDQQHGYRQIRQLLQERALIDSRCEAWIICGDLNVTSDSHVVASLHAAGFDYAHRTSGVMYTCNANARARMIDYVFHTEALRAQPVAVPVIDDQTPLPSFEQPSDHLALMTHFVWDVEGPARPYTDMLPDTDPHGV